MLANRRRSSCRILLEQVCQDDHLMSGLAGRRIRTAYRVQITREFCLRFRYQTKVDQDSGRVAIPELVRVSRHDKA